MNNPFSKIKLEWLYFIAFTLLIILYFIFRGVNTFIAFTLILVLTYLLQKLLEKNSLLAKKLKKIFYLLVVAYLIITYFHFRGASWDGLNLYLRNVLLIKDGYSLLGLETPPMPFLLEFVLALIYKFDNLRLINLTFGIISILTAYTTFILYRTLGIDKKTQKLALLVLIGSPTFLSFATFDFKVDMFLLLLANISYILFVKFLNKQSLRTAILLGLSLAAAVLTKVLFLPIPFFLVLSFIISMLVKRKLSLSLIKQVGLLLVSFLIPVIVWIYYFGLYIPNFSHDFKIYPGLKIEKRQYLDRNEEKLKECFANQKERDFGEFMYNSTIYHKIFQPYFYLRVQAVNSTYLKFYVNNPGIFIYLTAFFLPFMYFVLKRKFAQIVGLEIFYFTTLTFLALFFIFIKTIYWYLFSLFPLFSLFFVIFLEETFKSEWVKRLIELLVLTFCILNISVFATAILENLDTTARIDTSNNQGFSDLYKLSVLLDRISGEKLILNASEHHFNIFLTFIPNYSERVIDSKYYFEASGKNLEQMYQELTSKNIDYIVVDREKLYNPWYQKCPLRNNKILDEFLEKYTKQVNGSRLIFELI